MLKIKESLLCSISGMIFRDPVTTNTGQTFEKEILIDYMKNSDLCPLTRFKITSVSDSYLIKGIVEILIADGTINEDEIYKNRLTNQLDGITNLLEIKRILSNYRFTIHNIQFLISIDGSEILSELILKNLIYDQNDYSSIVDFFTIFNNGSLSINILLKLFETCNFDDIFNFIRTKEQFEELLKLNPTFLDRIFTFNEFQKYKFMMVLYQSYINIYVYEFIIKRDPYFFNFTNYMSILRMIERYSVIRIDGRNLVRLINDLCPYDDAIRFIRASIILNTLIDIQYDNFTIELSYDKCYNHVINFYLMDDDIILKNFLCNDDIDDEGKFYEFYIDSTIDHHPSEDDKIEKDKSNKRTNKVIKEIRYIETLERSKRQNKHKSANNKKSKTTKNRKEEFFGKVIKC